MMPWEIGLCHGENDRGIYDFWAGDNGVFIVYARC